MLRHKPGTAWLCLSACLASSGNFREKSRLERLMLVLGAWEHLHRNVWAASGGSVKLFNCGHLLMNDLVVML